MIQLSKFDQSDLLKAYKQQTGIDSLGICMRLSFKWLACRYVGGVFKYEKVNVKKMSEKMDAYSQEAIGMLKAADFEGDKRFFASKYVVTDLLKIKDYINKWGVNVTDANKVVYNNIYCADSMRTSLSDYIASRLAVVPIKDMALMITFYMTMTKQSVQEALPQVKFEGPDSRILMAGHAVAYFGGDNTFFDPNTGVWQVESSKPKEIAEEIEKHIADGYPVTGNNSDRAILRIAQRD